MIRLVQTAFLLSLSLVAALPSSEIDSRQFPQVVVISDVHGDDLAFMKSLWIGLRQVNESEAISFPDFRSEIEYFLVHNSARRAPLYEAPDTLLIQMGDLIDRGKYGHRCIKILAAIEPVIGFTTRNLYGNHDVFAMIDWGYEELIHPEEDLDRTGFSRGGPLWTELIEKSLVAIRVGNAESGTLLVHAGMDASWIGRHNTRGGRVSVERLNTLVTEMLADGLKPNPYLQEFFGEQTSPVMTRTVATGFDEVVCGDLDTALAQFGASRMIVGHTPQSSRRVNSRCGGRFVLSDVAMSRWMLDLSRNETDMTGGQPSAMILLHGADGSLSSMKAFYTNDIVDEVIFEAEIMDKRVNAPELPEEDGEDLPDKENMVPVGQVGGSSEGRQLKRRRMEEPQVAEHVVYEDRFGVISHLSGGEFSSFSIDCNDPEQIHRIEFVAGEMLPFWALADMEFVPAPVAARKRAAPHMVTRRVLLRMDTIEVPLLNYDHFGYMLADQITGVVRYFHEHRRCIGLVPRTNDPVSVKENADAWVRSFFSVDVDGNGVTLINLLRVHSCENDDLEAEEEYVFDALSDYLEEDEEEGDLSDDDEDGLFFLSPRAELRVRNAESFLLSFKRQNVPEVIQRFTAFNDPWGLPTVTLLPEYPRVVLLNATDHERLIDHDLSGALATQILAITERLHSRGICVGYTAGEDVPAVDRMDQVRLFFSTDGTGNSVTLVNLAFVAECVDVATQAAELAFVRAALVDFLDEDDEPEPMHASAGAVAVADN